MFEEFDSTPSTEPLDFSSTSSPDPQMEAFALSLGACYAWREVGDTMRTEILRTTDPLELLSAEETLVEAQERINLRLREIASRRVELTTDRLVAA